MRNLVIEEIKQLENDMEELSKLLKMVVNDGASIGFASTGTKRRNKVLANSIMILYVAKINNEVAGSIQLQLVTKPNGIHRAEICKLMTHPNFRRNGIGRSLMQKQRNEQSKKTGLF